MYNWFIGDVDIKLSYINIRDPFILIEGDRYYLFATFMRENGRRGTFLLVCDKPDGELCLTYHHPNKTNYERPIIKRIEIG